MHRRLSDHRLEELLRKLANQPYMGEDAAPDLARRICLHIQQARRRTRRLRMALSLGLALLGAAFLAPSLSGLAVGGSVLAEQALPQNGLLVVWEGLRMLVTQGGGYLAGGLQALLTYQVRLQPASAPAAPGLILLALSAILVMDLLFPREVFE